MVVWTVKLVPALIVKGPYTAPTLSHSSEAMPQSDIKLPELQKKNGADERTRTADLLITNQLLYQLSYVG